MKPKLFVIKSALTILTFIDFLEDLPQKTIKYTIKIGVLCMLSLFFLLLIAVEHQTKALSDLIAYLFIPDPTVTHTKILPKYPVLIENVKFPEISAKSVSVVDVKNNEILYEEDAHTPLPPASTTKIMTALVALELFPPTQKIVVPELCTVLDTQKAGFIAGELVSVDDLVNSLLITSAGDAACALAYADTYGKFIGLMNKKSLELGAVNTNFVNPVGFDDALAGHYSSAADLSLIAQYAVTNPKIRDAVAKKEYSVLSGTIPRTVFNTNSLLWEVEGSVGIKTGKTDGAGEVLVYQYTKDDANLIIVVMGSLDRFGDTKKILDWALASYDF